MAGAIALGVTNITSSALKRESFTPQKVTIKRKFGKIGFEVLPVIYGGIIPISSCKELSVF